MTRIVAAIHEIRCRECRVTWRSWVQRLVGIRAGYSPRVSTPTHGEQNSDG